jgi:hypothetical protein
MDEVPAPSINQLTQPTHGCHKTITQVLAMGTLLSVDPIISFLIGWKLELLQKSTRQHQARRLRLGSISDGEQK